MKNPLIFINMSLLRNVFTMPLLYRSKIVKCLMLVMFVLATFQSKAQFQKGEMALGGTVGLDLQSSPKNDNGVSSGANNIYISPGFGILLRKNLEIGIAAGYSHYTDKSEYGTGSASGMSKRDMNGYGASAYLRKYWMVSEKFFFYCIGSSGYGYSEDKLKVTNSNSEDYTQESKDNSIGVRVAPGFMFFPSAHWAFNAYIGSISYTFTKNKTDDVKTNHFTLGYGQIGFGLYYFIRKSENK